MQVHSNLALRPPAAAAAAAWCGRCSDAMHGACEGGKPEAVHGKRSHNQGWGIAVGMM